MSDDNIKLGMIVLWVFKIGAILLLIIIIAYFIAKIFNTSIIFTACVLFVIYVFIELKPFLFYLFKKRKL